MRKYLLGISAAAIAALVVGCGSSDTGASHQMDETSTSAESTGSADQAEHNDQDIAFAQGMIPHHQQAIDMADMAAEKASNAQVKDLASRIQAAQDPEIQQLTDMLEMWGAPTEPTTSGESDMPGMDHGMTHDETGSKPLPDSPWVDMRVMSVSKAQDDPGVGLRGNGRRVLTLADLRSDFADPDGREPGRTLELHLTGSMERYAWGFDGVPYSESQPLRFDYGERLRIVLVNDTMMEHPIHLHGLWSDLEDASGAFQLRKHTISVPPGHLRSYRVSADALGRWAFHCHMLLHMELGMFREVRVE